MTVGVRTPVIYVTAPLRAPDFGPVTAVGPATP